MLRFPSPESIRAFGQDKTSRSLLIKGRISEVIVHVPSELWITAERIRDDFRQALVHGQINEQWNEFELLLSFVHHAVRYAPYHDNDFSVRPFLKNLFLLIHVKYLECEEPHTVIESLLLTMEVKDALKIYYEIYCLLEGNGDLKDIAPIKSSALLKFVRQGSVNLVALFGGQGNTEFLLEELIELHYTYQALCHNFIREASAPLLEMAKDPAAVDYLSKGFNVMKWLEEPENRPPNDYLFSAAISLPLVGLVQLANYYIAYKILQLTPGEMAKSFVGTTGHSQGIVAACVIAKSKDEEELLANSTQAMKLLFWIGLRSMQAYPSFTIDPKIIVDCLENSEGQPSPMLAISNLTQAEVIAQLDVANEYLPESEKIHLALKNGPRTMVCSGPPKSLYGLNLILRKIKAPPSLDQSKTPFTKRKARFSTKFLPISSPFHCKMLEEAVPLIMQDVEKHGISFTATSFLTNVITPDNGKPAANDGQLIKQLVEQICFLPVNWPDALKKLPATHFVDFGPGKSSGIGALTFKNLDGTGIQVLLAGVNSSASEQLLPRLYLVSSKESSVKFGVNWVERYGPKLVQNEVDGKLYVDTSFSRLLGKQPLMVPGMTPSTVNGEFVAACLNAGYHVELAGGGLFNEALVRDRVNYLVEHTPPGTGITLNVLFINQRLWAFQFPLAQSLRQEGKPIDGFTVAAGVPSLEVANEIISSLRTAGIRHISFKPGSLEGIIQVVTIAKNNLDMPVILQWTGGRAGGHHSYEDFHQPILETYSAIRSCPNICLIAGSGFGDGAGTVPYLDGSWSITYDYPPMPFDGFLFGSRMMVAAECKTSPSVKDTIVAASGVANEKDWVNSYEKPAGGVVTVVSELGEPIHKIATRGVLVWKEFDQTIFKLPKEKRLEYLKKHKKEIIIKLNRDSHKVWFGRKASGEICDLEEMSYGEVLNRLAQLLYVSHQSRWIDRSYRQLFFDFLGRTEERLCCSLGTSCLPSVKDMEENPEIDPHIFLDLLRSEGSLDIDQLITTEDCLHLLSLCRRVDRKPVPFVPVLDADFEAWYKKDSLWQSEDVDAVVDGDPQRVCILQGPVAAKFCTKTNEPAKTILDNIAEFQIEHLLKKLYHGKRDSIPKVECFGYERIRESGSEISVAIEKKDSHTKITPLDMAQPPSLSKWLDYLAGERFDWITALLTCPTVIRGKSLVPNIIRQLFKFNNSHCYCFSSGPKGREKISIEDTTGLQHVQASSTDGRHIKLIIHNRIVSKSSSLELHLELVPGAPKYPLVELLDGRNRRVKEFYWNTWFPANSAKEFEQLYETDPLELSFSSKVKGKKEDVEKFCRVVGNNHEAYIGSMEGMVVPMDFLIVLAWQHVIKCLFPKKVDGDLLALVHLSNQIAYLSEKQLSMDKTFDVKSHILSILWTPTGKVVETEAIISENGDALAKVVSKFMYRGHFDKNDFYFTRVQNFVKMAYIESAEELAILKSKQWIDWNFDHISDQVIVGSILQFSINYVHVLDVLRGSIKTISLDGHLFLKTDTKVFEKIANINFISEGPLRDNPVLFFIERMGHPSGMVSALDETKHQQGLEREVIMPTRECNASYSEISGDTNPIHTNSFIANLAELPGTITHGMWTSAAVRAQIETFAADNCPLRLRDYRVSFDDMVLPGQKLFIKLGHVGMRSGCKIINVEAQNAEGVRVLRGTADIDQPKTAFVFTGQGSQEVGMGMDLYQTSNVAKHIWDSADQHFKQKYGFSILDIVRNNPKTLTIYFGGPKGRQMRRIYMDMKYEMVESDGTVRSLSLFPDISEESRSFTFKSPNGLLFATQFTQPALTLLEKAQFEDMKSKGLIGPGSLFAGHSLGEYAALASIGDVLSIETLCDVVFYRGLAMQVAVSRDEQGRSNYGMVAINPSKIGPEMDGQRLLKLVQLVSTETKMLLEIVNYNVENWQYVVAGKNLALCIITDVLNHLGRHKIMLAEVEAKKGEAAFLEMLITFIREQLANKLYTIPLRGIATIPLVGIDVPFHSSFLLGGVSAFRKCLEANIKATSVDPSVLQGKYIPNLTGRPFEISKECIKQTLTRCNSPVLQTILKEWDEKNMTDPAKLQKMGRILIIELLAYQFASPVQWIETQDVFFRDHRIERLIELGPSPVLINMAERTIKIKYQAYDDALNQRRDLWSYVKNRDEIYHEAPLSPASNGPALKSNVITPPVEPIAAEPSTFSKPQESRMPLQRIDDLPLDIEEFLRILITLKTKKSLDDVKPTKSIKELSGGKSTLQNEILADLQKEFADAVPERSEELPITELAAHIKGKFSKRPGKFSTQLISKMMSLKMPAGFTLSVVKEFLEKEIGLIGVASDQLLMYSLAFEPATRLSSDEAAKEWLRTIAGKFFDSHNMARPAAESMTENIVQVSSVELEKLQAKHRKLIRQQIELFAAYVEQNLLEFQKLADDKASQVLQLQNDLDLWLTELGQQYFDGIKPLFSSLKVRSYDSYWNWSRQDVYILYHELLFGRLINVDRDVTAKCLHVMNRASPGLLKFMEYHIFSSPEMKGESAMDSAHQLTRKYGEMLIQQVRDFMNKSPRYKDVSMHTRPQVSISFDGTIEYNEVRRSGVSSFEAYVKEIKQGAASGRPWLYIRDRALDDHTRWEYNEAKSGIYLHALADMAVEGVTFEGKIALVTGCGRGSIGCEVVKGLLSGGAKVIVTTSSFNRSTIDFFRSIYECHGARSSCLIVAPFNQASVRDVESLVNYIYDAEKGLGWDLDYVIPFAAISENGRTMTELDARSELAHRIMLTNVLRLLGAIAMNKINRRIESRPAQVILPLSPNHGNFGGDGLYGESKLGLETLFNRWHSEGWASYLSVAGAVIGWTRGTGLMNDNNLLAEAMERSGIRTFSPNEMAFNLLGLMHPRMVEMAEESPLYGDLNGGLDRISNLADMTRHLRSSIMSGAQVRRALAKERALDASLELNQVQPVQNICRRANLTFSYPLLKEYAKLPQRESLTGLLDLDKVVVITGFAEVGPWGNSRTRWEMEAEGEFSLEGCVEMAWLMGLIRYSHNGPTTSGGSSYSGWVDARTGEPVDDLDIKGRYEKEILAHSGIRLIEPELFDGYDPNCKSLCQEIVIDYDLPPIAVSTQEEAEQFKLRHGPLAESYEQTDGTWMVRLRRGATIYVPKALRFDRLVAGQIPTGWKAERYGVPLDIVNQVDPITLYVLVATVEALVSAGITDPYEFYRYVHISEVGNTSGGGEGGMVANKKIYQQRFLDKPAPADILQESFINTMPAWINLLILSSSGPIKTPVGACATAVESVEIGTESILAGRARICIVGGYDDFTEESSYEFAQMKATSNAVEEMQRGRQPDEMSRPTASSRSGFMEAHGAGIQVLMTAELALQIGCPIYGIVAATNTATDKAGRSIPAPGRGILTTARSIRDKSGRPRILDLAYRRRQLERELQTIREWYRVELEDLTNDGGTVGNIIKDLELEAKRREKTARQLWAHDFWKADPRIAPLEGALATYGLTIDDVGVASFHGTGTKANDPNEAEVVNTQLEHLGRTTGNLLPCVFQKYLTGHPKGAAAAWMLNGALQILSTGIIPGNRNADNIDNQLKECHHLLFLSRSIQTTGIRAALLKSFGFGQVGGEVLVVHPDYLFSALSPNQYNSYQRRRSTRHHQTFRYLHDMLVGVAPLVQVKNKPPYEPNLETAVYLNPHARASYDAPTGSYSFKAEEVAKSEGLALLNKLKVGELLKDGDNKYNVKGVGVDVQLISELSLDEVFLERNFTCQERQYCQNKCSNNNGDGNGGGGEDKLMEQTSLAGRWAAKEAIVKALSSASKGTSRPDWLQGPGGSLREIEILPEPTIGYPMVRVRGEERPDIKVSISHSGSYAVAMAVIVSLK